MNVQKNEKINNFSMITDVFLQSSSQMRRLRTITPCIQKTNTAKCLEITRKRALCTQHCNFVGLPHNRSCVGLRNMCKSRTVWRPCIRSASPIPPIGSRSFSSRNDEDEANARIKPVFVAIPNPIKIVRNKIFFWLIRSYFDPDFTIEDFTQGATQALITISKQLAEGAWENLEGLVAPKLLRELRETSHNYSLKEMSSLSLNAEDVLHSFPQNIAIHYDDKGGKFLFILMRFWCHSMNASSSDPEVKGFRIGRPPPGVSQEEFDNMGSVFSCTYEFHRDITPGAEPRWIITYMQHGQLINSETKGLPEEE